ncbi:MAG TPA: 50S ribosomal protein L25/general stress protein Ctc [Propionicimonas sp.]|uniref:50S ribosomal protein L25/general stress protein Ctc n=1 Tax=Propionicimonas sp. TaxID=1955623 RepID=UPI002F4048B2
MSESKIAAVSRTEFGKGAARRTRRAGLVPAVIYGHGTDPVHLSLPGHELLLALRVANAVLEISIDGAKTQLALAKQVQRDPIRSDIEHVDLVIVRKGEKVTVEVALVVVGTHPADRMILMDQQTIALEVEATHIPTSVEIDVTGLEIGDTVAAKDLKLPQGAVFSGEPEDLMLSVAATPSQEALDAELAGDAGAAPVVATPEVAEEA